MVKAIEIKNLCKRYEGGTDALRGIDLEIEQGDFFALLGPNGAGKSTTIGIMTSLVTLSSGQVSVMGHDLIRNPFLAKQMLGVVPQEFNFNIFTRCIDILINQGGYYGVPRSEAKKRASILLEALGLADKATVPAGRLSGGFKRRLMIARALIHHPKILVLDEPTAGVDITLRRSMWDFLNEQNRNGLTIILTTHYLEEAEQLCNKIAIIDKGKIIENTGKKELLSKLKNETLVLECDGDLSSISLPGFPYKVVDHTLEIQLDQEQSVSALVNQLTNQSITVKRIQNKANRLEELFIELTTASENAA